MNELFCLDTASLDAALVMRVRDALRTTHCFGHGYLIHEMVRLLRAWSNLNQDLHDLKWSGRVREAHDFFARKETDYDDAWRTLGTMELLLAIVDVPDFDPELRALLARYTDGWYGEPAAREAGLNRDQHVAALVRLQSLLAAMSREITLYLERRDLERRDQWGE